MFGLGAAAARRREYQRQLAAFIGLYPGGMRAFHKACPEAESVIDQTEFADTPPRVVAFKVVVGFICDMASELSPDAKAKALEQFRTIDWGVEWGNFSRWVFKDGRAPLAEAMTEVRLIACLLLVSYAYRELERTLVYRAEMEIDCALRGVRIEDLPPETPFVTFFDPVRDATSP